MLIAKCLQNTVPEYSLYLIKWEFDKMGLLEFSGEELTHTFLSENRNSIK